MLYLQGGAPPGISWFRIPLTIDISTISPSEIRAMFTNLAIDGGHHIVDFNNTNISKWGTLCHSQQTYHDTRGDSKCCQCLLVYKSNLWNLWLHEI